MTEAKFFTTDGQEIFGASEFDLVPECLEEEIQEMVFARLEEDFSGTLELDTRGSDLLRFKIMMGLIPDIRRIPRMRIRKPGWEGRR